MRTSSYKGIGKSPSFQSTLEIRGNNKLVFHNQQVFSRHRLAILCDEYIYYVNFVISIPGKSGFSGD
jgi:hypothetical protein